MFVALELTEQKNKGIFDPIFNILTKPKAHLDEAEALGAPFGLIRAAARQGVPDWGRIEALADRFADRMLLPDGVIPPEDSLIAGLRCPRHEKRVLLETACALIQRTRMPMYRRVLGLIDEEGDHADLLYPLLRQYTSVQVVTRNTAGYTAAAEEMMERLGAPVQVGTSLSLLSDCVLILAPGAAFGEEAQRLPCPVLCGDVFDPPWPCRRITALEAATFPELDQCCPQGISPHRLAGALYEYCDVDTGSYVARKMLYNSRLTDVADVVRALL